MIPKRPQGDPSQGVKNVFWVFGDILFQIDLPQIAKVVPRSSQSGAKGPEMAPMGAQVSAKVMQTELLVSQN